MYTALDEIYSRPILEAFERETGIRVRAQYDVESQKTVGLKNRIVHEASSPRCDVFWNNEIVHTLRLKERGLLEPYTSPEAERIPAEFKDAEHYWTGFASRARVIVFHRTRWKRDDVPQSLAAFAAPKFRELKKGIALPLFGTTATHFAVAHARLGEAKFIALLQALKANGVQILDSNANVMRMVGEGNLDVGFTDSDDANLGREVRNLPLGVIAHDQQADGTLLIPNTLALIKNAPHRENGRKLIDYLLRAQIESQLARSPSAQIPIGSGASGGPSFLDLDRLKVLDADFARGASVLERTGQLVREHFARE